MAIDYKLLNKASVRHQGPCLRIRGSVGHRLEVLSYFSALDMTSGFWQLRLTEEEKPKTALAVTSHWTVPVEGVTLWFMQCTRNVPQCSRRPVQSAI